MEGNELIEKMKRKLEEKNFMKIRYFFVLLLVFSSCTHSKQATGSGTFQDEPFTDGGYIYYPIKNNRIAVDLDKPQKASLFDYFKQIELIPLETNDSVLIGRQLEMVIYHQNKYYALDRQQQIVWIFDETGKYVSKIAKRGQGPGEYFYADYIIINPFTGNIDILEQYGRVFSYDLSGNHIKTIQITDDELRAIHGLIALDEKTYVFFSRSHDYKIIYYCLEKMTKLHQEFEENRPANHYSGIRSFYDYNGKWYFFRSNTNDTYIVGADSLVKAYLWDFGKYNYDASKMVFPEGFHNDRNKIQDEGKRIPYLIDYQRQNNRYVMAQIHIFFGESENLMYDKSINECKYIKSFDESVAFLPYLVTNDFVLSFCIHDDLEKYVNKEMLDEANKRKFDDLLNAKEEENPIILKYYFK